MGQLYPASKLDANQVLKDAYNEGTQRLRVDANITAPSITEVIMDQEDDSVAIGDGTTLYTGTTEAGKHSLDVHLTNSNIQVTNVQIFTLPFDSITATYPSATQEVYQSRVGGIGGTVQETVTINYTDATKSLILNVARS